MRKSLLKTIVATAVVGATMALSSVAAWAENTQTTTLNPETGAVATNTTQYSKYLTGSEIISGSFSNWADATRVDDNNESGSNKIAGYQYTSSKFKADTDYVAVPVPADSTVVIDWYPNSASKGGLVVSYKESSTSTTETVLFERISGTKGTNGTQTVFHFDNAGIYKFKRYSGDNMYIGAIGLKKVVSSTSYTISGTVTGNYGSSTISLVGTESGISYDLTITDGNFSVSVPDKDSYTVAINSTFYEITSPTTAIAVDGAAVENVAIVAAKKALTEISGTIASNLGITGTIKFKSGNDTYTATIEDGSYSVVVPQNKTYTIDVLEDAGYKTSAYKINETSVKITTEETKELNLTATKITSWKTSDVGTTMPSVTIQKKSDTYKGIAVNATATYTIGDNNRNAKWDSSNGQVNSETVLTIPLDTATQALSVVVMDNNSIGYEISYTETAGVITVNSYNTANNAYSIFFTEINIIDKANVGQTLFKPYKVVTTDTDTYIIGRIAAADLNSVTNNVGLAGNKSLDSIKTKASTKSVSDKVYKGVVVGGNYIAGSAAGDGYYYFASKVTGKVENTCYIKAFADSKASDISVITPAEAA